ncbi:putative DNA-invertase from lambdoid prophage Rac [Pantoea sp. AN62]|nr:resolvase domain-containing protein [Klebsiella pneumoniae]VTM91192.1 Putative DNA-invertase from lambdoid prophage Rac [Raoultella ornithinolytica]
MRYQLLINRDAFSFQCLNGSFYIYRVHCLALGGVDLTSAAGRMTMQVISAVAEFERDLLLERTHSGIARAKASGKRFGRPPALNEDQKKAAMERLSEGSSVSAVAREFNTTRQTILRVKAAFST